MDMARSTRLVILVIKNIYTLWGRKRFLLPVTYFPTNTVYPFSLRLTGMTKFSFWDIPQNLVLRITFQRRTRFRQIMCYSTRILSETGSFILTGPNRSYFLNLRYYTFTAVSPVPSKKVWIRTKKGQWSGSVRCSELVNVTIFVD